MLWWLAELDLAPKLNKCGLSSGGIRLRTHLSTASVCNDTCRKHVCMDLREKPKCHFWGFQQAVLGTLKHFKDSRFLSEEVWTWHPCLRSPDILFIAYRHKDLADFFFILWDLFFPPIHKNQKGIYTLRQELMETDLTISPKCCLLWLHFSSLNAAFSFYTFDYCVT